MKSIEALKKLVGKTGIINDTCGSLEDCIKGCKCRFNEPKKECDDYNLVMTIKKDLKRLEQLEKAVKILKNKLVLDIETEIAKENDIELIGYWLVEGDTQKLYTIITKEEYELLKEVLGNE